MVAHYLFQCAYTAEAWAAQLANPQDRTDAVRQVVEKLGGTVLESWLAFGEYDVVAILEMPDNVSMAAFAMAGAAEGHLKACKTTPLMSFEEGMRAMKVAAKAGYRRPGKSTRR